MTENNALVLLSEPVDRFLVMGHTPDQVVNRIQSWIKEERVVNLLLTARPGVELPVGSETVQQVVVNWRMVRSVQVVGLSDATVEVQPATTLVCDINQAVL